MEKLDDLLFYHLDKAIKTYRQFAQRQLKQAGYHLTIDQWIVLKTIHDHPGIDQNAIAEIVFKDNASVTRIIDLLVKKKFIERSINLTDRRRTELTLPEGAKLLLQKINEISTKNRLIALKGLNPEDIEIAKNIMIGISKNCL